jgi:hypothetical protein
MNLFLFKEEILEMILKLVLVQNGHRILGKQNLCQASSVFAPASANSTRCSESHKPAALHDACFSDCEYAPR